MTVGSTVTEIVLTVMGAQIMELLQTNTHKDIFISVQKSCR